MPRTSPTWSWAPSGARTLARTPLSVASKATVALSVSISTRESPSEYESPSLMFHFTILPSVMVGLNAGMLSFWCLGYDEDPEDALLCSFCWGCWGCCSCFTSCLGSGWDWDAWLPNLKSANCATKSFFWTTTMRGSPTGIAESVCLFWARKPGEVASNPTVALSVSTSQMMSPSSILSPIYLFHLTTLPSLMVGLSAGI